MLKEWKSKLAEHLKTEMSQSRPEQPGETIGSSGHEEPWLKPKELKSKLPKVEALTRDHLPASIREFVFSTAKRLNNAPVEYVAVSCLVTAASIIGGSAVVQPKRNDTDWVIVPTLWGALVGDPSSMKTPCMEAGLSLIQQECNPKKIKSDKRMSHVVNDVTPEAMAIILSKMPNGVMLNCDELAGWLRNLDKDDRAAERGFYLQAFNGSGGFVQDRVSRERIEVQPLIISVLGGIQPSLLLPLLKARAQGQCNDGLFERVQLMVLPDVAPHYVDIAPNKTSVDKAKNAFNFLSEFSTSNRMKRFVFSETGYEIWQKFTETTLHRSASVDILTQALLGKYSALCAKLALVFHLLSHDNSDAMDSVISAGHVEQAVRWMSFLESHYRRLMSLTQNSAPEEAAQVLLKRLRQLPHSFAKRDLTRKEWSKLTTDNACQSALERLVESGHLRKSIETNNGRQKVLHLIHPDWRG